MLIATGPAEPTYAILKIIALLIFFAAFMLILLRLIFTARSRYDEAARIPLDDDPGGRHPNDHAPNTTRESRP